MISLTGLRHIGHFADWLCFLKASAHILHMQTCPQSYTAVLALFEKHIEQSLELTLQLPFVVFFSLLLVEGWEAFDGELVGGGRGRLSFFCNFL